MVRRARSGWPSHLAGVLDDVGRSVTMLPARNWRSSTATAATRRCCRWRAGSRASTTGSSRSCSTRWPPTRAAPSPPEELGMGIHGGLDETSLLLHLRPDLVDMALAARPCPESLAANRHVRFGGPVSFGWTADDFGPSGVIGDPVGATAERGKTHSRRSWRSWARRWPKSPPSSCPRPRGDDRLSSTADVRGETRQTARATRRPTRARTARPGCRQPAEEQEHGDPQQRRHRSGTRTAARTGSALPVLHEAQAEAGLALLEEQLADDGADHREAGRDAEAGEDAGMAAGSGELAQPGAPGWRRAGGTGRACRGPPTSGRAACSWGSGRRR